MSSNLIKLIYSLNNEESSIAFDSSNKIASLKTLINLTQKINLDDYEVFYKKKEIKWTDETPIRNIIGKENVPIFYIKPKASKVNDDKTHKEADNKSKDDKKTDKPPEADKKADYNKTPNPKETDKKSGDTKTGKDDGKKLDNKAPINNKEPDKKVDNKPTTSQDKKPDLNNSTEHKDEKKELTTLKCKVIVEDFPSRPEFYELIEKYMENKQAKHEMNMLNTATGVEISFKNPDLAYEFMKYINFQKVNNNLYSKLRTNLVLDAKKVRKASSKIKKSGMMSKTDMHNEDNSLNTSKISPMLNNDQNSRFFKLNNQVSKSQNFKDLAIFEHFHKIKDEKLKHKILKKYYKNAKFVSLASPYMTEEERYRKEILDKKKMWYDKKGFINATQKKPIISPIPNYVNLDHYGESAVTHQFRHDFKEKNKWVDKNGKNFFV